MARKVFSGTLIGLSGILLLASVVLIVLFWVYNEPLTQKALGQLQEIDGELEQGEAALQSSQKELERALRIIDSTEAALSKFTDDDPQAFFEDVQTTLDENLLPELETAQERLVSAKETLENLRATLFGLNLVPFLQINVPDKILTDLIDSADALQSQVEDVSQLANQASTFLDDASYLLGGDFSETRDSLEGFLAEVETYQQKVADWREQVAELLDSIPRWIDIASVSLTFFFLWFGFSQLGLLLHGLRLWQGGDLLDGVRRTRQVSE